MKITFTTLLSLILFCSAYAQISEHKFEMSQGFQNGLIVTIPDAKSGRIDKIWKNYTRSYGKLIKNRKANEQVLGGVIVPVIHRENGIDIYMISEDNGMTVFFDLKSGFLNSEEFPQEYAGAKEFIQEFVYEVQREMVKEELDTEQDALKKLQRQLDNLLSDHKDYHQDIDEAKAKIKKAENNIIINEKDQVQTKALIIDKTKTVESVEMKLRKIGKPE